MKKVFGKSLWAAFASIALLSASCSVDAGGSDDSSTSQDSSAQSPAGTVSTPVTGGTVRSNAGVSIIKAQGWLESAYVTWNDSAENYNVYYKSSSSSSWSKIDAPLIRKKLRFLCKGRSFGASTGVL